MKYLDIDWGPNMPEHETLGKLTEKMLDDGVRPYEFEEDKNSIYFDGTKDGYDLELTKKILAARRGLDGQDGTMDDYIFQQIYDFGSELGAFVDLTREDLDQIDQINFAGKIGTTSQFYSIKSTGYLLNKPQKKVISCVFNVKDDKMEYYREE